MACWDSTTMSIPAWIGGAWCACTSTSGGNPPQDVPHLTAWGQAIGAWPCTTNCSGGWSSNAPASTCPSTAPAATPCSSTSPCPTGQTCTNGVCVASSGTPPATGNPFDFNSFFNSVFTNPGQAFQNYPGAGIASAVGLLVAFKVALGGR